MSTMRVVFAALLAIALSGCIRMDFNLCDDDPPHPECLDAGTDAAVDGGPDAD